MNEEFRSIIIQSSLMQNISPDGFDQAIQIGSLRSVTQNGFFFMQGDEATHAYVLIKGLVKMLQLTPTGTQITLRMMTPSQTFGGIAILNPKTGYPATAQAAEGSLAIAWRTEDLREIASKEPSLSLNTMSLMHGYILELQLRQKSLVGDRVVKRIARILLKLASETGKIVTDGILINMPLSRQDVAEMSGTTLYTVSRTMSEWERIGILKIGREKVIIQDPHALVRISDDLIE